MPTLIAVAKVKRKGAREGSLEGDETALAGYVHVFRRLW
jgi:hypothetical protein